MTQIYFDDDRDYSGIVEGWVREFISTMDDGNLDPGDRSGDEPFGVKIIFDGYGIKEWEDEDGNYQCDEQGDKDAMSFAVFVHKNSLNEDFVEHEMTPWCLVHRPNEEVCIYCWYDANEDSLEVIPFEDNNSTELDHDFITDLINKIDERDNT